MTMFPGCTTGKYLDGGEPQLVTVGNEFATKYSLNAISEDGGTTWECLADEILATEITKGDLLKRANGTVGEVEVVVRFRSGTRRENQLCIGYTDSEMEFVERDSIAIQLQVLDNE